MGVNMVKIRVYTCVELSTTTFKIFYLNVYVDAHTDTQLSLLHVSAPAVSAVCCANNIIGIRNIWKKH